MEPAVHSPQRVALILWAVDDYYCPASTNSFVQILIDTAYLLNDFPGM